MIISFDFGSSAATFMLLECLFSSVYLVFFVDCSDFGITLLMFIFLGKITYRLMFYAFLFTSYLSFLHIQYFTMHYRCLLHKEKLP